MTVKIGVGVLIINLKWQILLGKRLGEHGGNTWAPPGGHLEYGESPYECAVREAREETGLQISSLKQCCWTSDLFDNGSHYITLFISARFTHGIPAVCEPNKCAEWQWFDWNKLPQPLFKSMENFINQHENVHDCCLKELA